jgi:hypothetical protein
MNAGFETVIGKFLFSSASRFAANGKTSGSGGVENYKASTL